MLGIVVVGYLGLCAAARLAYRVLLYPAPADPPLESPPGASLLVLQAADGATVHALQFPPSAEAATTLVLFHGNGETIGAGVDLAAGLQRRGLGVVLVEYRGYGASKASGPPSEAGIYADAAAVLASLSAQGVPRERVALMGISLGTGVASEMASRGLGASLVLVSPYTSITEMAQRTVRILPAALVCPDKFDTLGKAGGIRVPTLVIHGDRDEVIPVAMGRAVAGAIREARLRVVPGGHHNDLFERWGDELFEAIAAHVGG